MKVFHKINDLRNDLKIQRKNGKSIGFVPTMGFLHEGHVSLLDAARKNNDIVVLSIFVNPTQFGPNEDFDRYPRDFERDEKIALNAGVDYLFYPTVEEMYPNELKSTMKVTKRVDVLCGEKRPGHFDGVALVVTKLFNIVQPDQAYFGLKDAQQVAVIEGLVEDYNIPVKINPVATIREEDGLAKSSRNVYLSEIERQEAPVLYKSLQQAVEDINNGNLNPEQLKQGITSAIENKTSGTVDYVSIYSYPDLEPINKINGKVIIALAVKFSNARLIDNIIISI
ncbi:pantoate--beta-alanine ligase [Bacillus sp. AFS041924]|uniref:pantoate--beta-alanine ligase n=1 Tax=Bacillus sp. AFS041924 TaxID=2033503 RepID=UPI000BFBEBEB|nr:pantoate--beta-alanine ligase [Bacillus sp. AFS041924]PGS48547.1 pantoate--beta-alanine ligase [Bacillus sp. AFS041924]